MMPLFSDKKGPLHGMKLAKDICALVYHLHNKKSLLRTLLRNRKCSTQVYMQSRDQIKSPTTIHNKLDQQLCSKLTISTMVNVQLTQCSTYNPQQLLLCNGDEQPVNTIVQSPQVTGICITHSCTASRTKAISHHHCHLDHSTNSHPTMVGSYKDVHLDMQLL